MRAARPSWRASQDEQNRRHHRRISRGSIGGYRGSRDEASQPGSRGGLPQGQARERRLDSADLLLSIDEHYLGGRLSSLLLCRHDEHLASAPADPQRADMGPPSSALRRRVGGRREFGEERGCPSRLVGSRLGAALVSIRSPSIWSASCVASAPQKRCRVWLKPPLVKARTFAGRTANTRAVPTSCRKPC
jgi:hypothetical protein